MTSSYKYNEALPDMERASPFILQSLGFPQQSYKRS